MPRGPRLDAPGTLHHVIVRGIEMKGARSLMTIRIVKILSPAWIGTNGVVIALS
jgi:hypothetical protein